METKIKTLIIDDEPDAVLALELILTRFCPYIEIKGKAHNAIEGLKLINTQKPHLVFLDVDMPNGSGFDLLESLPEKNFLVVFVTAYNEYAIKAFKVNAIDYLLKPADIEEVMAAANKAKEMVEKNQLPQIDYIPLLNSVKPPQQKIAISTSDGIEYIDLNDIIHIDAEGSYAKICMKNKASLMVSKNLKEISEMLDSNIFYRAHNSHIVNLNHVKRFNSKEGGFAEMIDGSMVLVSKRNKDEFLERMNKMFTKNK